MDHAEISSAIREGIDVNLTGLVVTRAKTKDEQQRFETFHRLLAAGFTAVYIWTDKHGVSSTKPAVPGKLVQSLELRDYVDCLDLVTMLHPETSADDITRVLEDFRQQALDITREKAPEPRSLKAQRIAAVGSIIYRPEEGEITVGSSPRMYTSTAATPDPDKYSGWKRIYDKVYDQLIFPPTAFGLFEPSEIGTFHTRWLEWLEDSNTSALSKLAGEDTGAIVPRKRARRSASVLVPSHGDETPARRTKRRAS